MQSCIIGDDQLIITEIKDSGHRVLNQSASSLDDIAIFTVIAKNRTRERHVIRVLVDIYVGDTDNTLVTLACIDPRNKNWQIGFVTNINTPITVKRPEPADTISGHRHINWRAAGSSISCV